MDAAPDSSRHRRGSDSFAAAPDFSGDPDENAGSLANLTEIWLPCLNAIEARSGVEIGAYRGKLTGELASWAATVGGKVTAIDPAPHSDLLELEARHPELELRTETSFEALPDLAPPDAIVIDGDHNYYTVSEELRLIAEKVPGLELPLLIFHDVAWPLARRDSYFDPDVIPEEHRHPFARDVALVPGDAGIADAGMPFACVAVREGGARNGVLTAIEDFMATREGLRLAIVPAFFGLGVLWHEDAPRAEEVAEIVEPWDRNPLLQRLEANRVVQVAERWAAAGRVEVQASRRQQQENLLRAMLGSSAFALAERLSRLRQRGGPVFSREQVRRALGESDR